MHVFLRQKIGTFLTVCLTFALVSSLTFPQMAMAAEKKDKAAKRAALMMQKMKQDMEAEKTAMQAQFDTQKKAFEDQLLAKESALEETNKELVLSQRKAKNLSVELTKTLDEKTAIESKLSNTQVNLESTNNNLNDLQSQHKEALADLKVNDNQRKTLSANLANTTKQLNTCAAQNVKLHQFGTELIHLYDQPSQYEALMRKEPFFQLKRVELENILQNQQDNLNKERFSAEKTVN